MTEKDCGHDDEQSHRLHRQLFTALLIFIGLILFTILLIFIILRPTHPSFILRDATIYQFNASTSSNPKLLTTNIQLTLSSRNPNQRIGIFYTRLDTYASYRDQQITLPTLLPETYQGHKEVVEWSPFIYGQLVPMAPYLGGTLDQDLNAGTVLVNIKVDGQVRWKVGTWVSGRYRLHVNCPAMLVLKNPSGGAGVGAVSMKVQLTSHCTVDV